MSEQVDDPIKGIALANTHIRKLEQMIEESRQKDDLATASRCEGHLVKWTEILEHFIRQKWQMGYTSEDITQGLSKGRKHQFKA